MSGYRLYLLTKNEPRFPEPLQYPIDPSGLFAVSEDLGIKRLINAYSIGIFPWNDYRQDHHNWYCPPERFVIFPEKIHISHSMRTLINKDRYRVSFDQDFEGVIRGCSEDRTKQLGAWLGPEIIESYTKLHKMGYAHSVEVWEGDKLVGGLYGVREGKGFFGESMFSRVPSASKLALIALAKKCQEEEINLIDCQLETNHLKSMGGEYITYKEFRDLISDGEQPDTIKDYPYYVII